MTRRPATTLILSILLFAVLLFGHLQNYELDATDDRLWLYFTSLETRDRDRAYALQARVHDTLEAQHARDIMVYRFDIRTGYNHNYIALSWLWRLGADLVRTPGGPAPHDYPAYLARSMIYGSALCFLVASTLFVGAFAIFRDQRMLAAAVVALAISATVDAAFRLSGIRWEGEALAVYGPSGFFDGVGQFIANSIATVVHPGAALSPFGTTGRSYLILLLPIVFALRWSDRPAASYAALLAFSTFHQSQAALLFGVLVAVDVVTRPLIFFDWRVTAAAAANVLSFALRETLDTMIGLRLLVWGTITAVSIVLGVCVAAGRKPAVMDRVSSFLARRAPWTRHSSIVRADVLALLAIWVLVAAVGHALEQIVARNEASYFWSQLSARSLSVIRPALLLAFGLAMLELTKRVAGPAKIAIVVGIVALPMVMLSGLRTIDGRGDRLRGDLVKLDATVGPALPWDTLVERSEAELYYALARYLDIGR